uniref:Uncharacterized protein n=1 Tax=Rhizophora mucronata TaxID=61149 RepID=A0A2P2Q7W5_RHIMU
MRIGKRHLVSFPSVQYIRVECLSFTLANEAKHLTCHSPFLDKLP